jgi:DNA polymerase-3 subunit alpha
MRELIAQLRPDCFEDIVALVALFRPGPAAVGHGRELHRPQARPRGDLLPGSAVPARVPEPILEPTYGIILYQEQVMQIAQVLAGYTLGGPTCCAAPWARRSPRRWPSSAMCSRAAPPKRGVDATLATKLFDLVEKFAGYGFNKSHSAAYALVSYQTAWLKAHHPAAFMAAVMSSELQNTDKIVILIEECKRMRLTLRLPDINEGEYMFTVNEGGDIVYGLGAIKGLGARHPWSRSCMRGARAVRSQTCSISAPARTRASSTARRSRRWCNPAPSIAWARSAGCSRPPSTMRCAPRSRTPAIATRG